MSGEYAAPNETEDDLVPAEVMPQPHAHDGQRWVFSLAGVLFMAALTVGLARLRRPAAPVLAYRRVALD